MRRTAKKFTPNSLPGLIAWYKPDEAGLVRGQGMAAQFTAATSEYLSIADNAALSMGDIDFTIETWVYKDSSPANNMVIVSKHNTTDNKREYQLFWKNTTDKFYFVVSNDGTTSAEVKSDTLGNPSNGQWYHIIAWHDATANTINIQVNNGTADSTAHTTGVLDSDSPFQLGARATATPAEFWDGRIGVSRVWKRTLTAAEKTYLYNAGVGRAYDELDPSLRVSLIACWELNEPSGTRTDIHGANNLTDNNTVTTNPGTILNAIGSARDFSSFNNPAVQTTQAKKPRIRQSSSTGRDIMKFDGVNDVLSLGDQTFLDALTQMSIFVVVKPTTVTTSAWASKYNDTTSKARAWYFGSSSTGFAQFIVYDESVDSAIGRNSATLQVVAGELAIFSASWDGRLTTGVKVFKNGLQIDATDNGVGLNFVAMENVATVARIGAAGASGADAYLCDGEILEVIIYNRGLNDMERKRVERYLSLKHGVSLT